MHVDGLRICTPIEPLRLLSTRDFQILVMLWWSIKLLSLKKPPSFDCLGHDSRVSGAVLVVSVVYGTLREVYSAKVRQLGERSVSLGDLTSILKIPLKWSGTCLKLKFPLWNIALEKVQDIRETYKLSCLLGKTSSETCEGYSKLQDSDRSCLPLRGTTEEASLYLQKPRCWSCCRTSSTRSSELEMCWQTVGGLRWRLKTLRLSTIF